MRLKKYFIAISVMAMASIAVANTGGIQLDTSRIIFQEGQRTATYGVRNHYSSPALASASVSNFDGSPSKAFVVSPSIYQIQPSTAARGQIIQLEPLDKNKETVLWLNIKTIVAENKEENKTGSGLEFSISQRIKMFYRPKTVKENCIAAAEKLRWEKTKDGVKAINESKVSVSLVSITDGKTTTKIGDTILPLDQKEFKLNININKNMKFMFVDEYGNFLETKLQLK